MAAQQQSLRTTALWQWGEKTTTTYVAVWQEWRHHSAAGITEGTAVVGHLPHCMARGDVTQVTHSACFMNYTSREALSLTQASLSTDSVHVHYTQYSENIIERFSIAQNDMNIWYSDIQSRITVNYYHCYDTPVVYRWFWQENV